MFEESRFIKMMRKGNLDQLKKFLEKNPSFLTNRFYYNSLGGAHYYYNDALDAAISFNQPEIVKYLITKIDINLKEDNTLHLHKAARQGSYEAAVTLLELGANPKRWNCFKEDAYECSKDQRLQELLLPYHQDLLQEEKLAAEQREQKEREAAEAKIAGTWTLASSSEVVHQHQPEGRGLITDIFNFATRRAISIGDLYSEPPLATGSFDDIPDKSIIAQASAKLEELNKNDDTATAKRPSLRIRKAAASI